MFHVKQHQAKNIGLQVITISYIKHFMVKVKLKSLVKQYDKSEENNI